MVVLLRAPSSSPIRFAPRHARSLHASLVRRHLVGPPDPISHLRPIIYDDAPPPPPQVRHPYSLSEFTGDTREYQWKMQRQELDALNQEFWTEVSILVYRPMGCASVHNTSVSGDIDRDLFPRQTRASTLPRTWYWRAYQRARHRRNVRLRSPNSTPAGSCKSAHVSTSTTRSGIGGIGRRSCSAHASCMRRLSTVLCIHSGRPRSPGHFTLMIREVACNGKMSELCQSVPPRGTFHYQRRWNTLRATPIYEGQYTTQYTRSCLIV